MNPAIRQRSLASILIASFAVAALCVNVFLLTRTLGGAAIAGCGGGPCDEVLASRWSSLLGVPVPAFGVMVYALLLMSFVRRLQWLRLPLLGGIAGAAVWFIFVQAVILRKFCPWCMTAHGIGIAIVFSGILSGKARAARHVSAWGALAVFAIVSMQVFGPVKAGHRLEGGRGAIAAPQGASVSFNDGRLIYQIAEHPRLGPADAERVLVEYFDYQCASCRIMADHMEALIAGHPGSVAVLLMPVPLDESCNAHLGSGGMVHPGSCEITRIALAVWRGKPKAFAGFHKELIAGPSASAARRLALGVMTEGELALALSDPWIAESIETNIAAWRAFSQSTDKLPKLLIRDKRILHGLPSSEADFLRVMKLELGL